MLPSSSARPMNPLRQSGPPSGGPPPMAPAGDPVKSAIVAIAQAVESGQVQGLTQKVAQLMGAGGPAPAAEPEGDEGMPPG